MLNYGSYIVQHGSNLHVVDAAEFVSDDFSHVYDVVIVCQTTEASLTVLSTNEENGGISYLHVDTGVDCPDTPRDATLVDLHRTDIAVTGISWFVAPEHGAAFEHIRALAEVAGHEVAGPADARQVEQPWFVHVAAEGVAGVGGLQAAPRVGVTPELPTDDSLGGQIRHIK